MKSPRPTESSEQKQLRVIDFLVDCFRLGSYFGQPASSNFDHTLRHFQDRTDLEPGRFVLEEIADCARAGSEELYFIENTLVPAVDGLRILGPYNAETVRQKRKSYDILVGQMPPTEAKKHPFTVYKAIIKLEPVKF